MMRPKPGYTKQGVRDLGQSKPKPKVEIPPETGLNCKHARVKQIESGDTLCLDCKMLWDWNGDPW